MRKVKTRTQSTWENMLQRVKNPKNPRWDSYGGAGITVCDRWLIYENFLADMGERPEGTTLDRFPDNNGNYEPSNCRWATPLEQQNNMRSNRILEYQGRKQPIRMWARELNLNFSTLAKRIGRGWTPDEALGFRVNGKKGRRQ
jgi:hypothetical protein